MSQFQVLFSGQITDGAAQDIVMRNLARSLGLDDRKVGQLFSGRTVVVKSQMSEEEAFALQDQFSDLGAVARVKDLTPAADVNFKVDNKNTDHTLQDITAAHRECPRCGHMQLESQFCARCGVDIIGHAKQSRKEDILIAKKIREMQIKKQKSAPLQVDSEIVFEAGTDMETEDKGFGKISGWISKLKKK